VELYRALAYLIGPAAPSRPELAAALGVIPLTAEQRTALFDLDLPPYASRYLSPSGEIGGELRQRAAGFFQVLDLPIPPEPDHLASLLDLLAWLADGEAVGRQRQTFRHLRETLVWEHLLPWVPLYLSTLVRVVPGGFRPWCAELSDAMLGEAKMSVFCRAEVLPVYPPVDWEASLQAVASQLLSPARSGLWLTRQLLIDLSRSEGLPAFGGRVSLLAGLLRAAPLPTLQALSELAGEWSAELRHLSWLGPIAEHWQGLADRGRAQLLRAVRGGPAGPPKERREWLRRRTAE
jgi:hypothetical protein